jgi:hypothetical protein
VPLTSDIIYIHFYNIRYNGSSIQFIGPRNTTVGSKFEWGILGGTGEFACAQGVISCDIIRIDGTLCVMELNIRALCLTFPKPDPNPIPEVRCVHFLWYSCP